MTDAGAGIRLGIIGGGQLGMMLTEAAGVMPKVSRVTVLDPTPECPASRAGAEQIVAGFGDGAAIRRLAEKSDVITYEIESGDCNALDAIEGMARVSPSPETLRIIQDKLMQKKFLKKCAIPVGDFREASTVAEIEEAAAQYGYPMLLKARRDAYDGRGNYSIAKCEDITPALEYFGDRQVYLEKFVDFGVEVSVIAARSTTGQIKTYPPVENTHKNGILDTTIAPARISGEAAKSANRIAHDTMGMLKGAGVFGIEMFVTRDDRILLNEIAPRVHNSGHHTLHSSETSQFEQHVRAILGMELGGTKLLHRTVMCNILGPAGFTGSYAPVSIDVRGAHLKMYGKAESRPGRKMGHLNVVATDGETADELLVRARTIRDGIRLEPAAS